MKKNLILEIICLLAGMFTASAQVSISADGSPPDSSAMLDVQSTTKGVLIPRMTKVQRYAITSSHTGLLVYQTNSPEGFYYYSDSAWVKIEKPCGESIYLFEEYQTMEGGHWVYHAGRNYHTILLGSQCWMKENMHAGGMDCGNSQRNIYGALYTWDQAMGRDSIAGARGICPEGWHIPTDEDWAILGSFLDDYWGSVSGWYYPTNGVNAGVKIKESYYWYTALSYPYFKDDLSGFDAKGSGYYNPNGGCNHDELLATIFWSSTAGTAFAYGRKITDNSGTIERGYYLKTWGCSVRCIKD